MCLLHLGPGLANGLTNLHNARRAFTPVLNVIGQHATWHLPADPLLATDIPSVARTVSDYVKENLGAPRSRWTSPKRSSGAMRNGGRIATLIVPHDFQIGEAGGSHSGSPSQPEEDLFVRSCQPGGQGVEVRQVSHTARRRGAVGSWHDVAGRIAAIAGADLLCDTFFARMERGGGLPIATRLPYFPDQARELTLVMTMSS